MYKMYGILQLDLDNENAREKAFEPYEWLERNEIDFDPDEYKLVWYDEIETDTDDVTEMLLDRLYEKFNINHPKKYEGRSMSVSDIIIFEDTAYYVDMIGFRELGNLEFDDFKMKYDIAEYFLPFC